MFESIFLCLIRFFLLSVNIAGLNIAAAPPGGRVLGKYLFNILPKDDDCFSKWQSLELEITAC